MGLEKGCMVFVFVCTQGPLDSGESGVSFLHTVQGGMKVEIRFLLIGGYKLCVVE
jgi:hypothetical protein